MERDLVSEYAHTLIRALQPKLNEVLSANPLPPELNGEEVSRAVLMLLTKAAFDFGAAQKLTVLQFSQMLRDMAETIEGELLAELQQKAAALTPTEEESASLEDLMKDGLKAQEKLDSDLQGCQDVNGDHK